jgi:hypothetical protein
MTTKPISAAIDVLHSLSSVVSGNGSPPTPPAAASGFETLPALPVLPPPTLPDNAQSTVLDIDEAEAPTVAQPVVVTVGVKSPAPTDVYVAPMSSAKQRFWQKMLCIGCCVPDN